MTNRKKRQYRVRDWRDHNSALVRRGSLTLWVEQGVVNGWRDTAAPARRGRRRTYSDLAITCALTLGEVYHLPLRATQGLVASVLSGIECEVVEVLGDGAYDFQGCYRAIHARGARSVIPPQVRARVRSGLEFHGRNAAVPRGREGGREEWKKEAGYHRRSLAETAMMRFKTIFSDRLKAREWRRQETELRVRCAAMNKTTSLGRPRSYAV